MGNYIYRPCGHYTHRPVDSQSRVGDIWACDCGAVLRYDEVASNFHTWHVIKPQPEPPEEYRT